MSEAEGYVEFSKIKEVGIREDGEEIRITGEGDDGAVFDMLIKADAIDELIANLQFISRSAQIKRRLPRPVALRRPKLGAQPALFLAQTLQGVVYPETGHLDIQIQPVGGGEIQVSIQKEQAKALFDLLLRAYNLDDQPPS